MVTNSILPQAEVFGDSFVLDGLLSPEEDAKITNAVAGAPWWLPVQVHAAPSQSY